MYEKYKINVYNLWFWLKTGESITSFGLEINHSSAFVVKRSRSLPKITIK